MPRCRIEIVNFDRFPVTAPYYGHEACGSGSPALRAVQVPAVELEAGR